MEMTQFYKSVLEMDKSPIVLCDEEHIIVYMNPAAVHRYADRGGANLLGKSLLDCHKPESCNLIERALEWFRESPKHDRIFEFHRRDTNEDVYMVALRDENGKLIGYYEKHEYRDPETAPRFDFREHDS